MTTLHDPFALLLAHPYPGSGTQDDPFLINWLPTGDRENPLKWCEGYKWGVMAVATGATLVVVGEFVVVSSVF